MRIATALLIVLAGLAPVTGWLPRTTSPSVPAQVPVPVPRSGPVCLKAVPVDPSIDSGFVKPVPDFGFRYTMRIIEAPECVTLAAQPWQQWPQPLQR